MLLLKISSRFAAIYGKPTTRHTCSIRARKSCIIYARGLSSPTKFIHKSKQYVNIVLNGIVKNGAYIEKNQ